MSVVDKQRDIVTWLIKLPTDVSAKEKEILLKKVGEFVETLGGKPVKDSDLAPGGKVWPKNRETRRAEILKLIGEMQKGPIVVPGGDEKKKTSIKRAESKLIEYVPREIDENLLVLEDQPLELGETKVEMARYVRAIKDFAAAHSAALANRGKKDEPYKIQTATDAFSQLGVFLFDALYAERDAQETDRPRHLLVKALVHGDVSKAQKEAFSKLDQKMLDSLVHLINEETQKYNKMEDKFGQYEVEAQNLCLTKCKPYRDMALGDPKLPEACKSCVLAYQLRTELMELEAEMKELKETPKKAKAMEKKIDEVQESLEGAESQITSSIVGLQIETFKAGLKKRLDKLYLSMIGGSERDFEALAAAMPVFDTTGRAADEAHDLARLDTIRREGLAKQGKLKHPTWTDREIAFAVEKVILAEEAQARAQAKQNVKATKEADKEFNQAYGHLNGTGKFGKEPAPKVPSKFTPKQLVSAHKYKPSGKVADQEWKPDNDESGSDSESDDEDEEDNDEDEEEDNDEDEKPKKKKNAGSSHNHKRNKHSKSRSNPPKTQSGAGSFQWPIHNQQPFHPSNIGGAGLQRPMLPSMLPPSYMISQNNYGRSKRIAGGCGCDPFNFTKSKNNNNNQEDEENKKYL